MLFRSEFFDPSTGVHLAMRRLSIIDLSGGHQPMSNEDQNVWIVFNGEIYNHAQLRAQLTAAGHRFRSDHSDTEVLVHLYEEEGEGMVERLNGMFAFVIYDKRKKRLFGARDRAGIKPLYYHRAPGFFAFASELKALLVTPSVSKQLDLQSVSDYLSFQCVPAPRSILKDVQKLPPAHLFSYALDTREFSSRRYWQPPCAGTRPAAATEETCLLVREQFTRAVLRWAMSDVPIACALSGGIDSSSIVGVLSQEGIRDLHTFTLGFGSAEGAALDERALARATARRWKTIHHEITIRPRDLLNDLDHMIWHLDEPYGGGLPSWYVFKGMKGIVKVGVTGTGGDELFGNYGKWLRYERAASGLRETARVALLDAAPGASARAL